MFFGAVALFFLSLCCTQRLGVATHQQQPTQKEMCPYICSLPQSGVSRCTQKHRVVEGSDHAVKGDDGTLNIAGGRARKQDELKGLVSPNTSRKLNKNVSTCITAPSCSESLKKGVPLLNKNTSVLLKLLEQPLKDLLQWQIPGLFR